MPNFGERWYGSGSGCTGIQLGFRCRRWYWEVWLCEQRASADNTEQNKAAKAIRVGRAIL